MLFAMQMSAPLLLRVGASSPYIALAPPLPMLLRAERAPLPLNASKWAMFAAGAGRILQHQAAGPMVTAGSATTPCK